MTGLNAKTDLYYGLLSQIDLMGSIGVVAETRIKGPGFSEYVFATLGAFHLLFSCTSKCQR